jgi:hypothetical protein
VKRFFKADYPESRNYIHPRQWNGESYNGIDLLTHLADLIDSPIAIFWLKSVTFCLTDYSVEFNYKNNIKNEFRNSTPSENYDNRFKEYLVVPAYFFLKINHRLKTSLSTAEWTDPKDDPTPEEQKAQRKKFIEEHPYM